MAFLNIEEAAKQFGMSTHSLRLVAKSGKLPGARKIGGRWFVHTATLMRYFESTVNSSGCDAGSGHAQG